MSARTVLLATVAFLAVSGCTAATAVQSTGALSVQRLAPQPDTEITSETILEAVLDYEVTGHGSVTYEIVPMFADQRGAGYTFSAGSASPPVLVRPPAGRVEIRYPIARELGDARLARPVQIWFFLLERGKQRDRVVARAGPFTYREQT